MIEPKKITGLPVRDVEVGQPGFAGADLFFSELQGADGAWVADGGKASYVPVRYAKQRVSALIDSGAITGGSFRIVLARHDRVRAADRLGADLGRAVVGLLRARRQAGARGPSARWRAPISAVGRRSST
jgi:hypothetical protein